MATTKFIEAGTSATQGFEFWTTATSDLSGAISSDAQAIFGSVRSIKHAGGASPGSALVKKTGILADSGRRIMFGFRFTGTLNVGGGVCGDFLNIWTGSARVFGVGLNNSGNLVLIHQNGTTVYGTGSTVLVANTDYEICAVYTITDSTHNSITIYLNGVSEIAVTNVTLATTGTDLIFLGLYAHQTLGANVTMYSAHIFIDDGSSGYPGAIRVTAKRPISNGTTNGMTGSGTPSGTGTGNARYVNERPIATGNFVSVVAAGSAITEEYNIESVSAGDVNITGATIVDYTGWVYAKALLSETGKIVVNNVQTNISLVNANTMFPQIAASATYPAGTGTDIGMVTATTATTVSLYEAGVMVAYIAASTTPRLRSLLGVGL